MTLKQELENNFYKFNGRLNEYGRMSFMSIVEIPPSTINVEIIYAHFLLYNIGNLYTAHVAYIIHF